MANEDFYTRLHQKLSAAESWPAVYMFKFILPNDNRKIALLRQLFDEEARFFEKASRKGSYISVTVKTVMLNPGEVIAVYKKVADIEGVIMF